MRKAIGKQITELQKTTIAKMNLVTMEDYKALEGRIKKLEGKGKKPVKKVSKS
jgi:BMFP domain-containing protein YqiC